jgi:hypothetical protein
MADRSGELHSQLYLLRVWTAPGEDGRPGWRGKLQPVRGDRSYCFANGHELCALLAALLPAPGAPPGDDAAPPGAPAAGPLGPAT